MKCQLDSRKVRETIGVLITGILMGLILFGLFTVVLFIWNKFYLYNRLPVIRLFVFLLNPIIVYFIWTIMNQMRLNQKSASAFFFLKSFFVMILIYTCCVFVWVYVGFDHAARSLAAVFLIYYSTSMFVFIASTRILQVIISAFNKAGLIKLSYIEFILLGTVFSLHKMLQIEEFYNIRNETLPAEYYSLPLIRVYLFGNLKLIIIFLIYCLMLLIWRKVSGYFKKMNISGLVYYRNGSIIFLGTFLLFSLTFILFISTLAI